MSAATQTQRHWRVPRPPEDDTDWYVDRNVRYKASIDATRRSSTSSALDLTKDDALAGTPAPTNKAPVRNDKPSSDEPGRLLASSTGQTIGTLLSRVTGLARIAAMSAVLGQSLFTDQFNNANTAPNMIYELLIGGVLSATLVPLFSQARHADDDDANNAIVSTSVVALGLLTVLAVVAAPLIHFAFTVLLDSSARSYDATIVVPLMRLLLPQIFLYGLMTLITATLHARERFAAAAFTPVLGNIVFIATFAVAHVLYADEIAAESVPKGLILVLGIGTTLGVAAMVFALFIAVYDADISFTWKFDPRHPAVRELFKLSKWTLGYAIANQIALLVITAVSRRDSTTLSAYQTAFVFFQLPHGLVAVSVMNSIVPVIARASVAGDVDLVKRKYREGTSVMMTVILLAAGLLWVAAEPLVRVCLGYGLFGAEAQALTSATVKAFALGLPGFSFYLLTLRLFYAQKDTRTPFTLCVVQNVLNVIFVGVALSFNPSRPPQAMAYAYSASYTIAAILAVVAAQRHTAGLVSKAMTHDLATAAMTATGTLVLAYGVDQSLDIGASSPLLSLLITGLIAIGSLAVSVFVLRQYGFEALADRFTSRRSAE